MGMYKFFAYAARKRNLNSRSLLLFLLFVVPFVLPKVAPGTGKHSAVLPHTSTRPEYITKRGPGYFS